MNAQHSTSKPRPVVHARPPKQQYVFGTTPANNFVAETWMSLPEGPEKEIAVRRWIAQELMARGLRDPESGLRQTALTFAEAWCGDWRPLEVFRPANSAYNAQQSNTIAPPPALRLVGNDDEDPFGD